MAHGKTLRFSQFYGSSFKDYVTTARQDRYNLIFSMEAQFRDQPTVNDDASSGGGRKLPPYSTEAVVVSLCITLYFI